MQQAAPSPSSCLEVAKTIAETAAYVAGFLFFVYKALTGYLIVNVSVSGTTDRARATEKEDNLTISATLKKGKNGSVDLHDARARVSYETTEGTRAKEVSFIGIERLSFNSGSAERKLINFTKPSVSNSFLRLAPEEEATFSGVTRVPCSATCVIEVAFIGKRSWSWKVGQWRTSLVSLPGQESASAGG
jgi:hypothetical protein